MPTAPPPAASPRSLLTACAAALEHVADDVDAILEPVDVHAWLADVELQEAGRRLAHVADEIRESSGRLRQRARLLERLAELREDPPRSSARVDTRELVDVDPRAYWPVDFEEGEA